MDLKSYIKGVKSRWVLLAQGAAFISLTIAGFVSPPSYFDPISNSVETKRLAVFISSLIVAIFFYLGHQFSLKKNARAWVVVTVLLTLTLVASFQSFAEAKPRCICRVVGENIGIGTDYTDLGKRDAQKHPGGLPSGVGQKRPYEVTSKPANEVVARDVDVAGRQGSLQRHEQRIERR